uniref:Vacuolar protein sorting-associated protein 51 homolog n=1 Tax=Panagrellus redivivus TaxID=6233 RepID=A0A7E4VM06_PANRE
MMLNWMYDNMSTSSWLIVSSSIYDFVIDFKQESVLAAVIKIGLKSLVEHLRVNVYSRNGLQQMQVDCLFLRGKLWAHVSDEHVLNTLIDDIVSSVVIQCQQPVLLDPKVANEVCELSDKQME